MHRDNKALLFSSDPFLKLHKNGGLGQDPMEHPMGRGGCSLQGNTATSSQRKTWLHATFSKDFADCHRNRRSWSRYAKRC